MLTAEMFKEVVVSGKFEDPYSELSTRLGVTRTEAKVKCYMFMGNPI